VQSFYIGNLKDGQLHANIKLSEKMPRANTLAYFAVGEGTKKKWFAPFKVVSVPLNFHFCP
jgi:hypothetical protein